MTRSISPDLHDRIEGKNPRVKPHIALICGGKSAEHEISCLSAIGIFEAIDREKFRISLYGITESGEGFVALNARGEFDKDANGMPIVPNDRTKGPLPADIDLIFPVLHGSNGEDGVFQGYAEFLQVNYLGSGVLASALAMDKTRAKKIFVGAGLKVAPGIALKKSDDSKNIALRFPLFVKPSRGGSSRGTSKVKKSEELPEAISLAFRFDESALVEEAIEGRELECAVMEVDGKVEASLVGEIRVLGGREFYDYEAKYLDSATEYLVPAPISDEIATEIRRQAIVAFESIGCEGLARVDFFLTGDEEIYINEINTMPGFTPKSVFPMLWRATGRDYREVISLMVEEALKKPKV